jgi:hypothetical protein
MLRPTRKATARGRSEEGSLLIGPPALSADMTPADVAFVLGSLTRFPTMIEIDRSSRDYLLDSVLARIGGRSR